MPLLFQLHLHPLATIRTEFDQFLRMLLPRLPTLILLVKTKTTDAKAVHRTEGRKNSAFTTGHGR
ncbi:hypothetical protein A3C37_05365 [Candidatus Peribacteria bacterium RIFCSPHIGHO2_02_FULL_53_20]|nr:MAG: hypothetical protein A3C37_05365 [Candidatus Peribacteria bacterium RIFCSPHIGHO2_02_FULL_53_20]OGJ66928.1 MAG: hypothetical protein A3B61_05030 [Candidatus Peribacteria bacterium RIFCSPLOWO2_01_FULL_53_10]OGJ69471.1 MAG: hypothetical protein A3G69_00415 [Candidatus Peribacteria bacterium RIFCSPLOWO2_12_FULL_53_10]